ncbi:MAG: sugar-binding transcriptional regulator [Roseitalea sp.]|jgi:DNA-binding transcriptional regulator LsrR (DeoR family)|uniref:sugar-binding transcriptional regulator n=1 Tax=Oceaniradius stylonematis TaxID=2184161 RepID=UPI001B15AA9C|nr:sugar-binding transcriptional regulator [Roseitalea sp.]MBO6950315.1 sugar-binding transcriptional regulator [Rhizobiaceae bacterium]MBO6591696.1 sugar-binding transcriptional regulator [Roseitalea sp.]MBO6599551.1 sugar-binding transcriptional regulator [Roseitalea sp.]MBO6611961.1 sugar-binding transcriptional regulator [Roseitalea sp.]
MPSTSVRRSAGQISGEDIVVEAAWLYYHDGLNQNEIAKRLNVSRATVVNYLQEARERGFINITLATEPFTNHRLAGELCGTLGLRAAYVLPDGAGGEKEQFDRVVRGAANWLPSLLEAGDRLGVAWGKTIYDMAEHIEPVSIPDLEVIQLVGSMATPYGFSAEICSANIARKLGANCVNLHAPAVLSTPEIAATLRKEAIIATQLDAIARCNKALFAVGSCNHDSHIVTSGLASHDDLDWYVAQGAAGVVCGRFIDANGEPVRGPLDERMIGIEQDMLRGKQMGLLVSVGLDKAEAMLAALRGGYATHLVTSQSSARHLLERAGKS